MNKQQKELLLREKEELERKKKGYIFVFIVIFLMIIYNAYMGKYFWLLIIFISLIYGFYEEDKLKRRINEIEFKLAGEKKWKSVYSAVLKMRSE